MKKLMLIATAVAALALIQGCASTQVAKDKDLSGEYLSASGSSVAHVYGTNWGLYCLSIPLISGSTDNPGTIAWGQDTVNVPSIVKMVTAKAKNLGGTATLDVKSNTSSFWIFPTFVLFVKGVEVSGNAVK